MTAPKWQDVEIARIPMSEETWALLCAKQKRDQEYLDRMMQEQMFLKGDGR